MEIEPLEETLARQLSKIEQKNSDSMSFTSMTAIIKSFNNIIEDPQNDSARIIQKIINKKETLIFKANGIEELLLKIGFERLDENNFIFSGNDLLNLEITLNLLMIHVFEIQERLSQSAAKLYQ